ncbi:glutathione synthetase [Spinellus fusiger]|nr:glutathione synthetase [Spinellus fusiger]
MSEDESLITEVMESLSKIDDFMRELYSIYLTVKKEGPAQSAVLGINRCDYLLHAAQGKGAETARIQQVEFNTISSSFGSLSTRTSELHRYLLSTLEGYAGSQIKLDQLPENRAVESIADGIASAWEHYGKPDAYVLMVIQPGERNVFDQRWIEYSLATHHGIRLIRRSLAQIEASGTLDPITKALTIDGHDIAVTYFRAGYGPEDYHSKKVFKRVPGRLELYVDVSTADLLRESFTGLYPLDDSPEGLKAYEEALCHPEAYVLKPQREGGGNNFYGEDIVTQLTTLTAEERNAYILMDLIQSPPCRNLMVREGSIIDTEVVSELGIYGVYLSDGNKALVNTVAGHLLRTKSHATNEGGVAAGFAVIDSPLLI